MSGLYTCRPDPDKPDAYEIVGPDGSVIDHLEDFHEVEETLRRLNSLKKKKTKDLHSL